MRTLIRNAHCVLPDGTQKTDVLIEDNTILDVAASKATQADDIVDASGLSPFARSH
ncbi:MAG: hypothetical protein R3B91_18360 [Planctomycetaceae bacterium]